MFDAILYFLASAAVPTAVFLLGAGALAVVQVLARAPREVALHERRRRELAEDCELWALERDRVAEVRMEEVVQQTVDKLGGTRGGAIREARAKVYGQVLREWGDRFHHGERELGGLLGSEGWAHGLVRRLRRTPASELEVPADCVRLESWWRRHVESPGQPFVGEGPAGPAVLVQRVAGYRPAPAIGAVRGDHVRARAMRCVTCEHEGLELAAFRRDGVPEHRALAYCTSCRATLEL